MSQKRHACSLVAIWLPLIYLKRRSLSDAWWLIERTRSQVAPCSHHTAQVLKENIDLNIGVTVNQFTYLTARIFKQQQQSTCRAAKIRAKSNQLMSQKSSSNKYATSTRSAWLLLLRFAFCLLLGAASASHAAYISRFTTITNGAVTFTGNTIGLNKLAGANAPGTSGAIGTFIASNNPTSVDGTYPVGTTATWQANASQATLVVPAASTVLYAELIWSGSYSYGGENVSAFLNNGVNFRTPLGANLVAPDAATAQTNGVGAANGTCTTIPCFYVRSANVTALVQAAGAGNYTVGGIPATQGDAENNSNTGGWTLAVVYGNASLPSRSLSVFVGAEVAGSPAATVSGFCTAPTGPRSGRLLVSALEGDSGLTGDQMQFGPTLAALTAQSGPNNPVGNFFASQINGNTGALDTSGSFGTANQTPGTAGVGRQGYDITNVDVSASLLNNQTTTFARGTTAGDGYMINALALQINVGAPIFTTTAKTVDKSVTFVGDTLTYTIRLDNTTGTADATNLVFTDAVPPGTSFLAGSLTIDGVASPGNPTTGVNAGTVAAGAVKVVSFKVVVNSIPASPASAVYSNSAAWTYQFISCAGQPTSNGSIATNPVLTNIARMAVSKAVSPAGTVTPGTTLSYTITLANDGTAASAATTLQDGIPANTSYVLASTSLNGIALADVAGGMPFITATPVNSAGQGSGVLAVGQTATVKFSVVVNATASGTITNTATGDIDGAGAAPASLASVSSPIQLIANLSITKTNGTNSVVAGSTTTYTITASNAGPSSANGSLVKDPVAAGLNCTAVTCAPSGGAACPAVVDIPTLQGTGLNISTFPGNSSVTFLLTCGVTATGQ